MKKLIIIGIALVSLLSCEKKEACQGANQKRNQLLEERDDIIYEHTSHVGPDKHYDNVNGTKYNQEEYNAIKLKEQAIYQQELIMSNEKNRCKFTVKFTESVLD